MTAKRKRTSIETGDWWSACSCPWTGCPRLALRPADRPEGCRACWLEGYLRRFPAIHGYGDAVFYGSEVREESEAAASGDTVTHPNRLAACLKGPAQRYGWILGEPPWDSPEIIAAAVGVAMARPDCGFGVPTSDPEKAVEWARWLMKQFAPHLSPSNSGFARAVTALENARLEKRWRIERDAPFPPPNWLWLISASTQAELDARAPHAAELARMGWRVGLHLEPLLGPVDIGIRSGVCHCGEDMVPHRLADPPHIPVEMYEPGPWSWVVSGAPKGHNCTDGELDWHRSILDQCEAAGVPYWLKSLGPRRGRVLDGVQHNGLPAGWPGLEVVP